MSRTRFSIGGQIVEIDDDNEEICESPKAIVVPLSSAPTSAARGRARLYPVCPLHGDDEYGNPCSKFAHLPGNGRGPDQPGFLRRIKVVFRHLVKPLLFLVILGGALFFATTHVKGLLSSPGGFGVSSDESGKSEQNQSNSRGRIQSDCFQPGNPCGLVLPSGQVK